MTARRVDGSLFADRAPAELLSSSQLEASRVVDEPPVSFWLDERGVGRMLGGYATRLLVKPWPDVDQATVRRWLDVGWG